MRKAAVGQEKLLLGRWQFPLMKKQQSMVLNDRQQVFLFVFLFGEIAVEINCGEAFQQCVTVLLAVVLGIAAFLLESGMAAFAAAILVHTSDVCTADIALAQDIW